jgi:hypothetical protein
MRNGSRWPCVLAMTRRGTFALRATSGRRAATIPPGAWKHHRPARPSSSGTKSFETSRVRLNSGRPIFCHGSRKQATRNVSGAPRVPSRLRGGALGDSPLAQTILRSLGLSSSTFRTGRAATPDGPSGRGRRGGTDAAETAGLGSAPRVLTDRIGVRPSRPLASASSVAIPSCGVVGQWCPAPARRRPRSLRVSPGPSRHRPPGPTGRPPTDPAIAPRIVGSRPVIGAKRRLTVNFGKVSPSYPSQPLQTSRRDPAPKRGPGTSPLPPIPSRRARVRARITRVRVTANEARPRTGRDHPASGSRDSSIARRGDGAANVIPAANSRLRRGAAGLDPVRLFRDGARPPVNRMPQLCIFLNAMHRFCGRTSSQPRRQQGEKTSHKTLRP